MERPYDIILFGASGFTGQLVARALLEHAAQESCRVALAGRDTAKLRQLLTDAPLTGGEPGVIEADIRNPESLRQMTAQGRVLISTVGPYNWYGEPVVQACLATGTHYLDITGEPAFVQRMIDRYHEEAREKGLCLVHCCGFDSIPADLGAWLCARALPAAAPKALRAYVRTNATFSGGTWTTAIHALYQRTREKAPRKKSTRHPDAPRVALRLHRHGSEGRWAIPMPVVDPHIVKRSARQLPGAYGEAFSYGQFFSVRGFSQVLRIILPIGAVMLLVRFRGVRDWLFRKFPQGTGPDQARRAASTFEVRVEGEGGGQRAVTVISGGDPGYDETAKMLAQAAFTLLQHLRGGTLQTGVLTPVEGLGQVLVDRLQKGGIRITTAVSA